MHKEGWEYSAWDRGSLGRCGKPGVTCWLCKLTNVMCWLLAVVGIFIAWAVVTVE